MSLKRAVNAIQKLYPLRYADSTWDNTGLLVDSSSSTIATSSSNTSILLTIDLTKAVVEEAINHKVQLIIAYHPFIFRGIKKIEPFANPQHDSLIKLISNGISVYSPHTAIDAAKGGVNDWLIEGVTSIDNVESKEIIEPNSEDPQNVGMGRYITLSNPIELKDIVASVKHHLGLQHLQLATNDINAPIKTVAICAGSGGGVFNQLKGKPVDLYLTGELSHHEVLSLKESGSSVIAAHHSNTERGYLKIVQQQLQNELTDTKIIVSSKDSDPYKTV